MNYIHVWIGSTSTPHFSRNCNIHLFVQVKICSESLCHFYVWNWCKSRFRIRIGSGFVPWWQNNIHKIFMEIGPAFFWIISILKTDSDPESRTRSGPSPEVNHLLFEWHQMFTPDFTQISLPLCELNWEQEYILQSTQLSRFFNPHSKICKLSAVSKKQIKQEQHEYQNATNIYKCSLQIQRRMPLLMTTAVSKWFNTFMISVLVFSRAPAAKMMHRQTHCSGSVSQESQPIPDVHWPPVH